MSGKKAKDNRLTNTATADNREFEDPTFEVEGIKASSDTKKPEETPKKSPPKRESVSGEDVLAILRQKGMKI